MVTKVFKETCGLLSSRSVFKNYSTRTGVDACKSTPQLKLWAVRGSADCIYFSIPNCGCFIIYSFFSPWDVIVLRAKFECQNKISFPVLCLIRISRNGRWEAIQAFRWTGGPSIPKGWFQNCVSIICKHLSNRPLRTFK